MKMRETRNLPDGARVLTLSRIADGLGRRLSTVAVRYVGTPCQRLVLTPINKYLNRKKTTRFLEIGPGLKRVEGFETLNVVGGKQVDYVGDAARRIPFPSNTFDVIYASHILEHIPWYQSQAALLEWSRVLKHGGYLEVWVPDGLKMARAYVDAEDRGGTDFHRDGWWRYNDDRDPCLWMSGRSFSYGDGSGRASHPNWHRAQFSERLLRRLFLEAGLTDIVLMSATDVRGYDHGWINLGLRGRKP